MKAIKKYFPNLTTLQLKQLDCLGSFYIEWNEKVNLVSRKDIEHIYDHHILHSLAIARYISFKPGTKVLDLGTGGGLPGLPLAICFPDTKFHLVDARSKKIMVVNDIIDQLDLENAAGTHARVESLTSRYDFIVSRAVAPIRQLLEWTQKSIHAQHKNAIPNGYILLKGGDLTNEMKVGGVLARADVQDIQQYFEDDYFAEKKIIYFQK